MTDTQALLDERGATHGAFADHARTTQRLKAVIEEELKLCKGDLNGFIEGRARTAVNEELAFMIAESLDMIVHKIGRIIAGDATHSDHWEDIAGYSQLVVNALNPPQVKSDQVVSDEFEREIRAAIRTKPAVEWPKKAAQERFEEEMTRSLK